MENKIGAEMKTSLSNSFEHVNQMILITVSAVIFIIGVLSNGTLLLIFARNKNIRKVRNIFILNLALGDLLLILIYIPFTITEVGLFHSPPDERLCRIFETSKDVSVGVSVFTLIVLSVDRYFAIADPLNQLFSSMNKCRAICSAGVIWTFAVLFATPTMHFSHLNDFNRTEPICYPYPKDTFELKIIIITKIFVYYIIPLTVIGCFYVLIARHLLRSAQNLAGEAQGPVKRIQSRKKAAKIVLAFVVTFAVFYFPQNIFRWLYLFSPHRYRDFSSLIRDIGNVLAFLHSCVNPFALFCVSSTFRKYFNLYLFRSCRKRRTAVGKRFTLCTSKTAASNGTRNNGTPQDIIPTHLQSHAKCRQTDLVVNKCSVTALLNGADDVKDMQ